MRKTLSELIRGDELKPIDPKKGTKWIFLGWIKYKEVLRCINREGKIDKELARNFQEGREIWRKEIRGK